MANILDLLCDFGPDRWFLSRPASGSALNGMLDMVASVRENGDTLSDKLMRRIWRF